VSIFATFARLNMAFRNPTSTEVLALLGVVTSTDNAPRSS